MRRGKALLLLLLRYVPEERALVGGICALCFVKQAF